MLKEQKSKATNDTKNNGSGRPTTDYGEKQSAVNKQYLEGVFSNNERNRSQHKPVREERNKLRHSRRNDKMIMVKKENKHEVVISRNDKMILVKIWFNTFQKKEAITTKMLKTDNKT